jgi:hypothetical protein
VGLAYGQGEPCDDATGEGDHELVRKSTLEASVLRKTTLETSVSGISTLETSEVDVNYTRFECWGGRFDIIHKDKRGSSDPATGLEEASELLYSLAKKEVASGELHSERVKLM